MSFYVYLPLVSRQFESPITNAISFDTEHWHSATLLSDEVDDPADHIEESLDIVLRLLERQDVEATFFVVGELAAEYPDLIGSIADAGHEIASHGHTHTPLFDLTPDEFEAELTNSARAIEDATGVEPLGFRAPNFSVTRETKWAFRVLEASDYRYDSSVFPVKTPMYGVLGAPNRPYRVALDDPFSASPAVSPSELVECPLSVADARFPMPIAGGFYARVLPVSVLEGGVRWLNRNGVPANLYFHPWEFNPNVRIDCSMPKRFVSFTGIEKTERKLERLLAAFDFGSVRDMLETESMAAGTDEQNAVRWSRTDGTNPTKSES